MRKSLLVLTILIGAILFLSNFTIKLDSAKPFHSAEELVLLKSQIPIGPGEYFQPSSSCKGCHGYDTLMQSNIDENGMDVNLFDHWESTMMALAAKDPLWRAKVSHEITINPAHALGLQTKCTSCHAPMGHYTAIYGGATSYTIAGLVNDTLGLDGVSCAGCHTIGPNAGLTFSGITAYDTSRTIYGPFPGPFAGPMQLYEGYTPVYSPHMDNSAVCSSCHTLVTETVDLAGNYTGGEFVEQATYHEYLNSNFPANNIQCQTCHMPQLADPIIIANGYINLPARTPFNQHVFAGANHFMLDLIKNNKVALNVNVADSLFDSTMTATLRLLQEQSVEFELFNDSITTDTAYYKVKIRNKAGHKFPSGYPGRRTVLQLVMTDANNDTIFKSGIFDQNYRVIGETAQFEPHHDIINQDNVSQIYELTMGDVNGQFTSVLERAAIILKDNRIPPDGFTTSANVYDTVKISADALADPNFNKINSVEGSGTDYVFYRVPIAGLSGVVKVKAGLHYQSVPPKWLDEMFTLSTGPIDTFAVMYQNADKTPILVASDSLTDLLSSLNNISSNSYTINIWPTLTNDGVINIWSKSDWNDILLIEIYNFDGKKITTINPSKNTRKIAATLPSIKGTYFIKVQTKYKTIARKVIKL
ncbi:MAG: T9SS type A sorting domain-containing protein [Bacteroidetes bacterium]|nr:T9SS type A sorting domain-containing protein [Bacteroidota bacterium]